MENSVNPNPYLVEKTIQKEVVTRTTVEETITVIDWSKVPNGTYMTAKISGVSCEGVVWTNPNDIPGGSKYFCQNHQSGDQAPFKFGFNYSWKFIQCEDGTHTENVADIQFPPKPEDLVIPTPPPAPTKVVIGDGGYNTQIISEDTLTVGCQTITKEQILNVLAIMENFGK